MIVPTQYPRQQLTQPDQAVKELNAVLEAAPHLGAKWWGYGVGHRCFILLIGELPDPANVVVGLLGCDYLAGPTFWDGQVLRAAVSPKATRKYPGVPGVVLTDETAGFRAQAVYMFWGRGKDPMNDNGWFCWGDDLDKAMPDVPLHVPSSETNGDPTRKS